MCGITGIIRWDNNSVSSEYVRIMNNKLSHRGPDGEGYYNEEYLSLGHKRLSIIDLHTGDQPIFNEDRSIVVVFNGEIYNYKQLRSDLIKKGHSFYTDTDTECIPHAFESYDLNFFNYLDGMFSFALWEKHKKQLILAVDRMGIKPLVYYKGDGWLAFSSELESLISCPDVPKDINHNALNSYFQLGYIPSPLTIYNNIFKLLPGHYLSLIKGQLIVKRYWNLLNNIEPIDDIHEAESGIREHLENAVKNRLISDVSLGAFLSGGIDSSIIVGIMARQMSKPVKTFSIGFKEQAILDETSYAECVAELNGTDHQTIQLNYSNVLDAIPLALDGMGEPFADYSFLPTWLLSKETRKYVTVALSGDGSDELFAGYSKYQGEIYQKYYHSIPPFIRKILVNPLINVLPAGRTNIIEEFGRQSKRFLDGISSDMISRHIGWMSIVKGDILNSLLQIKQTSDYVTNSIHSLYADSNQKWGNDKINSMLYTDVMYGLPFDMLTKVDLASMRNSLEVRVPFLDHNLVKFAFALSGDKKLNGLNSKYILKRSFKDILPKKIINRRKQGFDLPIGEWIKTDLREMFFDVVFNGKGNNSLLNYEYIKKMYKQHLSGQHDYTKILWSIFVFEWWYQRKKY